MRAVLLAAVASLGMVGCVGSLDMPPPGSSPVGTNPNPNGNTSMAKQMFEQNVYPIIHNPGAASDCSSCHSASGPVGNITGFVADTPDQAYATITSFQTVVGNFTPSTAGLLTRITNAMDLHVTQRGRSFTAAQIQTITDWLNQEVTERANGGGGTGSGTGGSETPAQATSRVLNQFSGCMTEANFKTAGMANAWGKMQANNGSACESCHATGGLGFIATDIVDSSDLGPGLWTVVSSNEYYLVQYFTVDLTGGAANAKVIINTTSFMGVSQGQYPHTEHPRFNATNNNGMKALQQFYNLTMQNMQTNNGNCGPTQLNPPA